MDYSNLLATVFQYVGFLGITAIGVAGTTFGLFKWLGGKWLENKFAERLQILKSEQEQTIRQVQSTIDREIHRAKKLYDNEFTALTESWRLLRAAYDISASTIGSMTADVSRMNDEELERHLAKLGMDEWKRTELKAFIANDRQDEYWRWTEWQKAIECRKKWHECQQQINSTSIFFPAGFSEKFRLINDLIWSSNVENENYIRAYKMQEDRVTFDRFEARHTLLKEGGVMMQELEKMVRDRLWSVTKEADLADRFDA